MYDAFAITAELEGASGRALGTMQPIAWFTGSKSEVIWRNLPFAHNVNDVVVVHNRRKLEGCAKVVPFQVSPHPG